ncbi:metalloregulator ArsR/SmtB family transcription factor [Amycolatopsis sp. NPDC023774]|uniref:ArsR/SmtB family transcription factor n=1 Tax=Amycolatopsis sp. NPDC023774 TaxID=3155015 RepID=UPI0033EB277E
MRNAVHPTVDAISLPHVLGALSDPVRIGLVALLADGSERGWGEFQVPLSKSTLSHHLRVLRESGITWTRQEGTRCFVRLRTAELSERFPSVFPAILAAAVAEPNPVTLAASGDEDSRDCDNNPDVGVIAS